MFTNIIILFFIYSFIGWIIDSSYISSHSGRFVNSGYFKGPICPIYGFGGLFLLMLFSNLGNIPLALLFLAGGLLMVILEYFGGVFSVAILGHRVWDYSALKYNIDGHISLEHGTYWFLLTIFYFFVIYPHSLSFIQNPIIGVYSIDFAIALFLILWGAIIFINKRFKLS